MSGAKSGKKNLLDALIATRSKPVLSEKCLLVVAELVFMSHKLTSDGINPAEGKNEVVAEVREASNDIEVRSVFYMVNYSARFIPSLATAAERLKRLTRKNVYFAIGPEQRAAYQVFKQSAHSL